LFDLSKLPGGANFIAVHAGSAPITLVAFRPRRSVNGRKIKAPQFTSFFQILLVSRFWPSSNPGAA